MKVRSTLLATACFALAVGCTQPATAPQGVESSTDASAAAKPLFRFATRKADVPVPCTQSDKDKCGKMDLELMDSGNAWADSVVNKAVLGGKTAAEVAEQLAKESADNVREGAPPSERISKVEELGTHGNLRQIEVTNYEYSGGAHGMTVTTHYLLDPEAQRQLTLKDLVADSQMDALTALVREQYLNNARTLNQTNPNAMEQLEEYYTIWPFVMTDDVYFSDRGLVFFYQPYDIASYAAGPQKLTVRYPQLQGILKPEFLPSGKP